jgi:plasmid maintenance system antidote protein VapI
MLSVVVCVLTILKSWLAMQEHYDLWQAKQTVKLDRVRPVEFAAA